MKKNIKTGLVALKDLSSIQELNYSPHWDIAKVQKILKNGVELKLLNNEEIILNPLMI